MISQAASSIRHCSCRLAFPSAGTFLPRLSSSLRSRQARSTSECPIPAVRCSSAVFSSTRTFGETSPAELAPATTSELTDSSVGTERTEREALETAQAFEDLGVNPNVAASLSLAFPHIRRPTKAQAALITSVLDNHDVVCRAHTGTGKTFGLVLALLGKPRVVFRDPFRKGGKGKVDEVNDDEEGLPGISSLLVVPNNDLAFQIERWVRALLPRSAFPSLDPVLQIVVRADPTMSPAAQVERLRKSPPHLLVGTATRLLEIAEQKEGLLGIHGLRTVAVDEADQLLSLPGRFPTQWHMRMFEAKPSAALTLLRKIMKARGVKGAEGKSVDRGQDTTTSSHGKKSPSFPEQRLQLVCASATANSVLRDYLLRRTGWTTKKSSRFLDFTREGMGVTPRTIEHHCLVVSERSTRNIQIRETLSRAAKELAESADIGDEKDGDTPTSRVRLTTSGARPDNPHSRSGFFQPAPGSIDPLLLEAVAEAYALDEVWRGILFIPSGVSRRKVVDELVGLGVPARYVENAAEAEASGEEPYLLVTSEDQSRGLDIPDLSHAFIMGPPSSPSSYVHMAGRVGRMGRQGRVILIVRGENEGVSPAKAETDWPASVSQDPAEGKLAVGDERKAASMYRLLDILVRPFPHVEE